MQWETCLHSSQNVVNNRFSSCIKLLLRADFLRCNWTDAWKFHNVAKSPYLSSVLIFIYSHLEAILPKISSCVSCRAHGKVSIGPNGKVRSRFYRSASEANHFCHCYPVVLHSFVDKLILFYISELVLWPAVICYPPSSPSWWFHEQHMPERYVNVRKPVYFNHTHYRQT